MIVYYCLSLRVVVIFDRSDVIYRLLICIDSCFDVCIE